MCKKHFRTVHPVLIIVIYIITLNIHPAAVVGQLASGVFEKIVLVVPVQQYFTDIEKEREEKRWLH